MSAKIVVACGSGIATSEAVASKLEKLLAQRKVSATIVAVAIDELSSALRDADAYVSVVKNDEVVHVPVFNGVAFLTGMGQEAELDKLIETIKNI